MSEDITETSQTVAAGQLRAFIERIERLEEEIKELNADKSDVYKELRGCGFDVKAVRQCVAARKLDTAEREERDAIFDLYWAALTGASTDSPRARAREGNQFQATNSPEGATKSGPSSAQVRSSAVSGAGTAEGVGSASAEHAPGESSAFNSPDAAAVSASSGRPEGSERLQVQREPRNAAEPDVGEPTREEVRIERGVSPSVTAGETATNQLERKVTDEHGEVGECIPLARQGDPDGERGQIQRVGGQGAAEGVRLGEGSSGGLTNSHSSATSSPQADTAGAVPPPAAPAAQFEPPAFLQRTKTIRDFRPGCLEPDNCAGYGAKMCHRCTKAAQADEAAA